MILASSPRPRNSHIWDREKDEHYVEPAWCSERLFQVETFVGSFEGAPELRWLKRDGGRS
jgi:hypothetical protein